MLRISICHLCIFFSLFEVTIKNLIVFKINWNFWSMTKNSARHAEPGDKTINSRTKITQGADQTPTRIFKCRWRWKAKYPFASCAVYKSLCERRNHGPFLLTTQFFKHFVTHSRLITWLNKWVRTKKTKTKTNLKEVVRWPLTMLTFVRLPFRSKLADFLSTLFRLMLYFPRYSCTSPFFSPTQIELPLSYDKNYDQ